MNSVNDYSDPYSFAVWIVQKLTDAGHQALFAGGCVRDKILGVVPKDYDVATSALPAQVQAIFGPRRTIAIGAAFGVISVIGNRVTGNVEIATFRSDGDYLDGRRPNEVTFTDAKNDALRRDFTINGLFYDPLEEAVLDYVGGQEDMQRRIIRAIGNPVDRFNEDKLRMLRAIRFATTLGFAVDQQTMQAIEKHAAEIDKVSGERVLAEMTRVLASPRRGHGLSLLRSSKLETVILPLATTLSQRSLDKICDLINDKPMQDADLEVSIGLLLCVSKIDQIGLSEFLNADRKLVIQPLLQQVENLTLHWRMSNLSKAIFKDAISNVAIYIQAATLSWSDLQPKLISPYASQVLCLAQLLVDLLKLAPAGVSRCNESLDLPAEILNPPPLLTGDQLMEMGVTKGPLLGQYLRQIRRQQLDAAQFTTDQAIAWVRSQLNQG